MSDRLTNAVTPSAKCEVRDAGAILTIIPEGSSPSPGTDVCLEEGTLLSKPMYTASRLSDVPDIVKWIRPDGKPEELLPYSLTEMVFEKV